MKSIIIPLWYKMGPRYSINTDSIVYGRFQFCVRLRAGWPLFKWGWRVR